MSHPFPDPHGPVREMVSRSTRSESSSGTACGSTCLSRTESLSRYQRAHRPARLFEEGEPTDLPGSYLNGFYGVRGLPCRESGYGYPESGQTVVNVTDGKDHPAPRRRQRKPMDLRYGTTEEHSRTLDFRTGTLRRETVWTSPTGRRVRIRSERLVSFTKRAIAAIHYEVEPLSEDMTLVPGRPARQRADPDSGQRPPV